MSSFPPNSSAPQASDKQISAALRALKKALEDGSYEGPELPPILVMPGYTSSRLYTKLRAREGVVWGIFSKLLFDLLDQHDIELGLITALTDYATPKARRK